MAVFDAYSTNDRAGTAPAQTADPISEAIYQALLGIAGQYRSQFEGSRDKLMSGIIPAAMKMWGSDRVLKGIQNPYSQSKARFAALSALTGKPYYDRTGDGSQMRLFYVPGYKPQGYADQVGYEENKHNYWNT